MGYIRDILKKLAEEAANNVTKLITKTTRLGKGSRRRRNSEEEEGDEDEEEDDASDDWGEVQNSPSMKLGMTTTVLPYNDLPRYAPVAPNQWERRRK